MPASRWHIPDVCNWMDLTPVSLATLIKRPEINYHVIKELLSASGQEYIINYDNPDEIYEQIEIYYKYEGYIVKAKEQAKKMNNFDSMAIPSDINYDDVDNIALEAREKFKKVKPMNIGQASRISGVNPADISVLVVYIEKMNRKGA
jgi:tRNA uridine 5-carboxymethylaminomethyl modification enzyme